MAGWNCVVNARLSDSVTQLLLLLLQSSRCVLLESRIRNLQATQSTDSNIQNRKADEGSNETHKDT